MQFHSLNSKFIPSEKGREGPLLVLVHGRTGNIRVLEWFSKRLKIEGLSYLMIEAIYPDQREDQKDPGFSWYEPGAKGIEQSREKLLLLINELNTFGFDSKNIYFLGFSQGAAMSLDIALRVPQIFGGFVCVSGPCIQCSDYPNALSPVAANQRILITQGTRDEIIKLEDSQKSLASIEGHVPFELKIYDKPHSFKLNQEVPYIESTLKGWMGL